MRSNYQNLLQKYLQSKSTPTNFSEGREDQIAINQAELAKEWQELERKNPEATAKIIKHWNKFDRLLRTKRNKQGFNKKNSFADPEADSGDKVLYKNPCLSLMSREINEMVDKLPPQQQATPGNYNIRDRNEPTKVSLFLKKCPPGTVQNVRKGICEPRPGFDLQTLCDRPNVISGKSEIQMLESHLAQLSPGGGVGE